MEYSRKIRQLSIAEIISGGITVLVLFPKPAELIIVELMPCTILNIASIKSENELQVLITPAKKKMTSNASPYCLYCSVYISNYIPYTTDL